MDVTDVERVLGQLRGAVIECGEETENGMHLRLVDGRIVIIDGTFIVALCAPKKKALH